MESGSAASPSPRCARRCRQYAAGALIPLARRPEYCRLRYDGHHPREFHQPVRLSSLGVRARDSGLAAVGISGMHLIRLMSIWTETSSIPTSTGNSTGVSCDAGLSDRHGLPVICIGRSHRAKLRCTERGAPKASRLVVESFARAARFHCVVSRWVRCALNDLTESVGSGLAIRDI
jgi:hypothetical protein